MNVIPEIQGDGGSQGGTLRQSQVHEDHAPSNDVQAVIDQ